jgi:WD40 repeat protein
MTRTTVLATPWQAKARIADHELVRHVGGGAFGEVWLARSLATGRFRAVKIVERDRLGDLHPYELEFSGVRKFEEVSREHEGFVDILHVCRDDAARYFAYIMEVADPLEPGPQLDPLTYVPRTLAVEIQRRGRLSPAECVRISLALTAALAALHERQLVHRDLKPSNIIFVRGAPKLADVGLITELKDQPPHTLVGSADYMDAQVHGTAPGDLYSLGKVLYVMATGHSPREWPAWPDTARDTAEAEIFGDLASICKRACHPERGRRYGSAKEIHAELLLLQAGRSFTRLKRLERLATLARRWGPAVGIAALVAGFALFQWDQQKTHRAKLNERKVGSYAAYGSRALEENNLLGALPWFSEALRLDAQNLRNAETHRLRLAAVLRQAPSLVQMFFTTGHISFASFAGQENQLLAPVPDGRWAVLDLGTGRALYPPFGTKHPDEDVCLNPATHLAMTTTDDTPVAQLWDTLTGQPVASLAYTGNLFRATLSRDGQWAAAISHHGEAVLWNILNIRSNTLRSNTPCQVLRGPGFQFLHLAFRPDGKQLITSGVNNEALLWDLPAGQPVLGLTNHTAEIYCAAFSPDGSLVATASLDRSVRFWDPALGRELPPPLKHNDGVFSVEFSADGQRLVTAGLDFTARVWDLRTREQVLLLPHNSKVLSAGFSPRGRYVVTATYDGTVRVWDLQPEAQPQPQPLAGFSGNGRRMALAEPGAVRLLDTHGDQPVTIIPLTNGLVTRPLLSHDGAKVLTVERRPSSPAGTTNYLVRRWNCATVRAREAGSLTLNAGLDSFQLSRNGACLLAHGKAGAAVWDLKTGQQLLKLDFPVRQGAFDPAAQRIALAYSNAVHTNAVQVWHLGTGQTLLPSPWLHHTRVSSIQWSPNGRYVATTCWDESFDPESARVWDAETGRPIGPPLQHRDGVCFATFNHQGNQVITCSEDFTAVLWDPATGRQLAPPLRHRDQVKHAAFSESDRWLATACQDGTIRLWDTASGEPLTPPLPHPANLSFVQWLDRDRRLAAGSENGTSWISDLPRDPRPELDLVLVAQLLSAEQIHDSEAIVPQTKEALHGIWKQLRTRYPDEFSLRP